MSRNACLLILVGQLLVKSVIAAPALVGVSDPARAAYNWTMKCQGCHQADASGMGGTPNMVGSVARFMHSKQGRAYLGRVPGVAFVDLPEQEVAELLNWMVQVFDGQHMPKNFVPYSAGEVKNLKQRPLISAAPSKRKELIDVIEDSSD